MPPNAKYVLLFDAHSIKKQSPILEFQREFPDSEVVSCGPQKHLSPREQDLIKAYVGAAGDYFVGSHHSTFSNGVALLRITQFGLHSFVYSCHTHVLYPSLTQYNDLGEGCPEKSLSVVGFWHIGPGASHNLHSRESVVCSQFAQIVNSPLFTSSNIDVKVKVITTITLTTGVANDLLESDPRFIKIEPNLAMASNEEYYEYPTLNELYGFCGREENADTIVFYFHSKSNHIERAKMDAFLFSRCARCLEDDRTRVMCGPNFRGVEKAPWCHFKGNFWMTRCSHIKKLNPPFFEELIYEANEANRLWPKSGRKDEAFPQGGWPHDTIPYGRFFSEYWVTNDALGVRPSHQLGYLEYGQHDKQTCLVDERTICTG